MAKRTSARGMNAALASGEAGVGEMHPARSPMRPRQFGVALVAAAVGSGLGLFTYHAVSNSSPTFSGQVMPSQTYYLNFSANGAVTALSAQTGVRVHKGEVLATQDPSVAQANLVAAQAAVTADQATLAADQNPSVSGSTAASDQLSITQATSAVNAAQNALSLQQSTSQNSIAAQQTAVTSAQNTYNSDNARYNSQCGNSSSGGASPSPSGGTSQEQFCSNLQSTVNHDYSALSAAQSQLASLQSSSQLQASHDSSNVTQSQAVLTAAQARLTAAGETVTPAALAQAKSQLATAQAQVATDQLAVQNTTIYAPADGMIADTGGAAGDMVGPDGVHGYAGPAEQAGTQQGQQPGFELFVPQQNGNSATQSQSQYMPLITEYAGPLDVLTQVPESSINDVHVGGPASINITALNLTETGTVKAVALDPVRSTTSTAYYDVTISITNADSRIMAGMSASVSVG